MIKTSFHNLAKVIALGATAMILGGCDSATYGVPATCKQTPASPHCQQLELLAAKSKSFEMAWTEFNRCVYNAQQSHLELIRHANLPWKLNKLSQMGTSVAEQCGPAPKWDSFSEGKGTVTRP